MRKYILFLFLPFFCFADWMQDQIQEDLKPFLAKRINSSNLKQFFQSASLDDLLMYVTIYQGRVYSYSPASIVHTEMQARLKSVHEFFNTLANHYKLPNVELIITLHDAWGSNPNIPIFTFGKNKHSTCVLLPDFEAMLGCEELFNKCEQASSLHPWNTKKEIMFWRGATTGGSFEINNYLRFPRAKIVFLSRMYPEWLDAAFMLLVQSTQEVYDYILANTRPLVPSVSIQDHFAYKYLIDVDGNTSTYSRCRWILMSNSTLVKHNSENIQWYYKALKEWVHYVPTEANFEDLPEVYHWLKTHDVEAQKIAKQGQELAKTIFSKQELERYVVTLLNEYAKLTTKAKS